MFALLARVLVVLSMLVLGVAPVRAQSANEVRRAEAEYQKGATLYQQGKFAGAIEAFTRANGFAPHLGALFYAARSHENLGQPAKALQFYQKAMKLAKNDTEKADIRRRVDQLKNRPVKVFVSSLPSGASVTVDGRGQPEPGQTPLVVQLKPGEHLLVVNRDGYHLAVRRVVVKMGEEQPVEVKLTEVPEPCPPPAKPCPEPTPCPKLKLTNVDRLRLQVTLAGVFGVTTKRPMGAGPGIQLYMIYKRIMVGTNMVVFPLSEEPKDTVEPLQGVAAGAQPDARKWETVSHLWWMLQLVGGYVIPFDTSYIYANVGLGLNSDELRYSGYYWNKTRVVSGTTVPGGYYDPDGSGPLTRQGVSDSDGQIAFTWSVGVGIQAHATKWLSFGAAARFGMIHGNRVAEEGVLPESGHFPYGTFWATTGFHL